MSQKLELYSFRATNNFLDNPVLHFPNFFTHPYLIYLLIYPFIQILTVLNTYARKYKWAHRLLTAFINSFPAQTTC